jgi:hypothetical protein
MSKIKEGKAVPVQVWTGSDGFQISRPKAREAGNIVQPYAPVAFIPLSPRKYSCYSILLASE